MRFEWDETKNRANYRKHRVWFEEAQTTWQDQHADEFFDPSHSHDEERFIRVGYSLLNRILLVVFCEYDAEAVRIISARKATPKERKEYEEGI